MKPCTEAVCPSCGKPLLFDLQSGWSRPGCTCSPAPESKHISEFIPHPQSAWSLLKERKDRVAERFIDALFVIGVLAAHKLIVFVEHVLAIAESALQG